MAKKVYAIKEGFDSSQNQKVENKIVDTWNECLKYVKGVKGAKYKSFEDIDEAKKYLSDSNDVLKKEDNNYPMDCLHIYVDGSYSVASGEYSYGMVAVKDDTILEIKSGVGKSDSANNIRQIAGELEGAIKGVEYAISKGEKKVVIFHDYIGICYHATGFWERKEDSSKRYYEKMQAFMNEGIEIIFVKVDSHTGDFYNELVDEKCKERLGIVSDRVVDKWLNNNKLYVSNESLKSQIISITQNKEDNILIRNSQEKSREKEVDILVEINNSLKLLSKENQIKVLDYIRTL